MTATAATASLGVLTLTIPSPVTWLFTPTADGNTAFAAFLGAIKRKRRMFAYALKLGSTFDALIAAKKLGLDQKVILDQSEAAAIKTEAAGIARLESGGLRRGVDYVIGTSQRHQIMHAKCTIQDDRYVEAGSWNYTTLASQQVNTQEYYDAPELASFLNGQFDALWAWILANEKQ